MFNAEGVDKRHGTVSADRILHSVGESFDREHAR